MRGSVQGSSIVAFSFASTLIETTIRNLRLFAPHPAVPVIQLTGVGKVEQGASYGGGCGGCCGPGVGSMYTVVWVVVVVVLGIPNASFFVQ